MRISKNLRLGRPITDLRRLEVLANEHKSVAIEHYVEQNDGKFIIKSYEVRPAKWVINWRLAWIFKVRLFETIKESTNE